MDRCPGATHKDGNNEPTRRDSSESRVQRFTSTYTVDSTGMALEQFPKKAHTTPTRSFPMLFRSMCHDSCEIRPDGDYARWLEPKPPGCYPSLDEPSACVHCRVFVMKTRLRNHRTTYSTSSSAGFGSHRQHGKPHHAYNRPHTQFIRTLSISQPHPPSIPTAHARILRTPLSPTRAAKLS